MNVLLSAGVVPGAYMLQEKGKNPVWVLPHKQVRLIRTMQRLARQYRPRKVAKAFVEKYGYQYPRRTYKDAYTDFQGGNNATPMMLVFQKIATIEEFLAFENSYREAHFVDEPMSDPVTYAKKLLAAPRALRRRFKE